MTRPILSMAAARAISLIFGVLLLGILARRLGPAGFGTLQFGLALMAYPTLLVDLGLTTFGLRELAKGNDSTTIVRLVLGARSVLAFAVLAVVVLVVAVPPIEPERQRTLIILAIGLPVSALNVRWVLQGERRFGRAAAVEILSTATQLFAAAILVQGTDDVVGAAEALTIAATVTSLASIAFAGRWARFRPLVDREIRRTIVRSLPLGAAAVAIAIYYGIDTVLLGILRGEQEVAFYSAAYRLILPILAMAGAVGTVAIPHLAYLSVTDRGAASDAASDLGRRLILAGLPIAVGGALLAEPIIATIYGAAFLPAVDPFRILIWSVLTVYANAAFAFLMLARHGDVRYLAAVAAGAVINVLVNLVAIPLAGMIGAALTTIASEVLVLALIVSWTRDVSLRGVAAGIRSAAIPTLAMTVAIWPVTTSIVAIPLGMVVFGFAAAATGAIPVRQWLDRRTPSQP